MNKILSLLITAGLLTGIGASIVPLTSYAADPVTSSAVVSLTITDSISFSQSTPVIDFGTISNNQQTATGKKNTLTVKSNNPAGYKITISGTALETSDKAYSIPYGTVDARGTTTGTTSAWGMSYNVDNNYTALAEIAPSSIPLGTNNYDVYFGLSVSDTQVSGSYTGSATFTLTNTVAN